MLPTPLSTSLALIRQVQHFVAPKDAYGFRLVLSILENEAVLERIPAIPVNAVPISVIALRAVLYQMCGTAVQRFPRQFTARYPTLAANGFAEATVGKKRGAAWIDRFPCAHALNIQAFLADYLHYLEAHQREIHTLARSARECLSSELRRRLPSTADAVPGLAEDEVSAGLTVSRLSASSSGPGAQHYLINSIDAIGVMEQVVGEEVRFTQSLPQQALALLVVQVVGNNLKKLDALGVKLPSLEIFTRNRDIFAHTNTLSAKFEYPSEQWVNCVQPYRQLKRELLAACRPSPDAQAVSNLGAREDSDEESDSKAAVPEQLPAAAAAVPVAAMAAAKKNARKAAKKKRAKASASAVANALNAEKKASVVTTPEKIASNPPVLRNPKEGELFKAAMEMIASLQLADPSLRASTAQFKQLIDTAKQESVPAIATGPTPDLLSLIFASGVCEVILDRCDHIEWLEILLAAGANPDIQIDHPDIGGGKPLLHLAYIHPLRELLALLLRYGADPNIFDEMGAHILEYINEEDFSREETFARLELLLRYGADPLIWARSPSATTVTTTLLLRTLIAPMRTEVFRLQLLRVVMKHICQNASVEKIRTVLDTPIFYNGKDAYPSLKLVISDAYPQFVALTEQEEQEEQEALIPAQCQQLLRQIDSLLETNTPLLVAVISGQLEAVQSRLKGGGITVLMLAQATKLAVEMGYPEMARDMKEQMAAVLAATHKQKVALPEPTSSAPASAALPDSSPPETKSSLAHATVAASPLSGGREFVFDTARYCVTIRKASP